LISDGYELPQGIRVADRSLPLQSLSVEGHASSRGGVLRFEASPLTIDLREAPTWNGPIPRLLPLLGAPWLATWRLLNEQQRSKATDLIAEDLFQPAHAALLTRKLSEPVQQLIAAARRLDPRAATQAARSMIGLGPGVTPSGDDILLGFLAGLRSTVGSAPTRQAFIQQFGDSLLLLSDQTTEISRTYLHHAILGQFSSSMIQLLQAFDQPQAGRLVAAAREAMQVGHSSGMDSVTGLLLALYAWGEAVSIPPQREVSLWQPHGA
jgi:hypothetical protein